MKVTQKIAKGNKLIAEFMGDETGMILEYKDKAKRPYHREWAWIIPVVEKIESTVMQRQTTTTYRVQIKGGECSIYMGVFSNRNDIRNISKVKIKAVYDTVVEFIKWHNKIKK